MIATPPAGPAADGIDLDQVHTTADASAWLHSRSAAYLAAADDELSPVRARALQLAGGTLQVYARVVGTYRDPTGIGAELGWLADDYRHPDRDAVEPIPEVHRLTCGHLAEVLGPLAQRLTHLNPVGLQQGSGITGPTRGVHRDMTYLWVPASYPQIGNRPVDPTSRLEGVFTAMSIEIPIQPIPDHIAEASVWLSAAERHTDQPLRQRLDAGDIIDILYDVSPPYPPIDMTKPAAPFTEVAPAVVRALEQAVQTAGSIEEKLRVARALGTLRKRLS